MEVFIDEPGKTFALNIIVEIAAWKENLKDLD